MTMMHKFGTFLGTVQFIQSSFTTLCNWGSAWVGDGTIWYAQGRHNVLALLGHWWPCVPQVADRWHNTHEICNTCKFSSTSGFFGFPWKQNIGPSSSTLDFDCWTMTSTGCSSASHFQFLDLACVSSVLGVGSPDDQVGHMMDTWQFVGFCLMTWRDDGCTWLGTQRRWPTTWLDRFQDLDKTCRGLFWWDIPLLHLSGLWWHMSPYVMFAHWVRGLYLLLMAPIATCHHVLCLSIAIRAFMYIFTLLTCKRGLLCRLLSFLRH